MTTTKTEPSGTPIFDELYAEWRAGQHDDAIDAERAKREQANDDHEFDGPEACNEVEGTDLDQCLECGKPERDHVRAAESPSDGG